MYGKMIKNVKIRHKEQSMMDNIEKKENTQDEYAIDYFAYNNKLIRVKTFFSLRARKKMFDQFMKEIKPNEQSEILDLGTTPDRMLTDSNLFDKLYPYKDKITVCSIENCSNIVKELGLKRYVPTEPKRPLPFRKNEFDVCICSAVLEHVGGISDQEFFLNECLRVAKHVFLTTPYRYFPIEMHTFIPFLHWMPWKTFQTIVKKTKGEFWASEDNLRLCCKRDIERMKLNKRVKVKFIRTAGIPSNMLIMDISSPKS